MKNSLQREEITAVFAWAVLVNQGGPVSLCKDPSLLLLILLSISSQTGFATNASLELIPGFCNVSTHSSAISVLFSLFVSLFSSSCLFWIWSFLNVGDQTIDSRKRESWAKIIPFRSATFRNNVEENSCLMIMKKLHYKIFLEKKSLWDFRRTVILFGRKTRCSLIADKSI